MPSTPCAVVSTCGSCPKNHSRSRLIGPPSDDARVVRVDDAGPSVIGDADCRSVSSMLLPRRPLAGGVEERLARERVAARARHEVHHRPAGLGLAQAAGDRDRDFVDVGRVVGERRDAAAVERRRDGHAVDRHAAFVASRPPCAVKNVIVGVAARPLLSTVTPGDGVQQRAVGARAPAAPR